MNLYFECQTGASGDMLCAALLDLFEEKESVLRELNALALPRTAITYESVKTGAIKALHMCVAVDGEQEEPQNTSHSHHHSHRTLQDIDVLIDALHAPDTVKQASKDIYRLIAGAESAVHGEDVAEVHFHELGMLDAVADIVICAYLIEKLKPQKIITSPINVGNGTVRCAHGTLPVPAPATAELLKGIPFYKSDIQTELCTPTGAAILRYYTDTFCAAPVLENTFKIGIGAGTKQLPSPNILRAFWEEESENIIELSCNVDDMTGEDIGFAVEQLLANGAADCFVTPVFMKKNRPAYLLTVLCPAHKEETFVKLIFRHTSTIGMRKYSPARYTLSREWIQNAGVSIKRSQGYGTVKEKAEFEDVKQYALEHNISIFEARQIITKGL